METIAVKEKVGEKRKRRKDIHNPNLFETQSSSSASLPLITNSPPSSSVPIPVPVHGPIPVPVQCFHPLFTPENLFHILSDKPHFETVFQNHQQCLEKRFSSAINESDAPMEIELRLGTWNPMNGNFKVGVSKDTMQAIMESAFAWSKKNTTSVWKDWSQSRDAFYKLTNGMQIRTETSISNDLKVSIQHVWKQKLYDSDFFEANNFGGRLSFSREVNISSIYNIPLIVFPDFVRIKQRKSLFYKDPVTQDELKIDFTLSWHGKSFLEADAMQAIRNNPNFEVEFEIKSKNDLNLQNSINIERWMNFINEILYFQNPMKTWTVVQSRKIQYSEREHEDSKKKRIS